MAKLVGKLGYPRFRERSDPVRQKEHAQMVESVFFPEMLDDLAKHYGIEPETENKWYLLSLCLAKQYVDDFQFRKASTPRKWKRDEQIRLVLEVMKRIDDGHSVNQACRALTRRPGFFWGKMNWSTLAARFREARLELKKVPADSFAPSIREDLIVALDRDLRQK